MRAQLFAALSSLRIGMNVQLKAESVRLDSLFAHGGLFKTKGVALLAAFARDRTDGQALADYLNSRVFAGSSLETIEPDPADVAGFDAYVQRFSAGLPIERAAVANS
jgi:hypothetical protein